MLDVIIKGGEVIDGLGGSPYLSDVGIKDGKIVELDGKISTASKKIISADGAIVTPGFVDIHTHFDGQVMEGVEDIPGTALYEGIPWGTWETFPEYLDHIDSREYTLDIGTQIAHGAVRNYVMGERGRNNDLATDDDLAKMSQIVGEALARLFLEHMQPDLRLWPSLMLSRTLEKAFLN